MSSVSIPVDSTLPVEVTVTVSTPVFSEVSIYFRLNGEHRWVQSAFFSLHDVDTGAVRTTLPPLNAGSGIKLRTVMWGGKKKFVIGQELRQSGKHCPGSPLTEIKGTVDSEGTTVDVDLDIL